MDQHRPAEGVHHYLACGLMDISLPVLWTYGYITACPVDLCWYLISLHFLCVENGIMFLGAQQCCWLRSPHHKFRNPGLILTQGNIPNLPCMSLSVSLHFELINNNKKGNGIRSAQSYRGTREVPNPLCRGMVQCVRTGMLVCQTSLGTFINNFNHFWPLFQEQRTTHTHTEEWYRPCSGNR